ncbi:M56 family metallopeptidase [Gimesia algae]|uniref:Regulatory protein BlaR1 n=1 Tax=Gimesia algae TaxID=2527971 RepID=A0A517VAB8_9PLAN|nr:M56 family metallopeptidase [Gimesia algae]QDT89929.1 Regulatory protein BlaR1 [Gimesia algae]
MSTILSELNSDGLLGARLVDVLIRITAVLAVGYCLGICLYRQSAAFLHGLWVTTLLAVACVPVASIVLPGWGPTAPLLSRVESKPVKTTSATPDSTIQNVASTDTVSLVPEDLPTEKIHYRQEPLTTTSAPMAGMSESMETTDRVGAVDPFPTTKFAHEESRAWGVAAWLLALWFLGSVLILAQILFGLIRLSRILKRSIQLSDQQWCGLAADVKSKLGFRRNIAIQEATNEIGPLTGGLINPFVILPSGCDIWSTELKQVVLLHEMAHVKRRDVLSLWWSRLVGATLWFHPLVWLVIRQLQIERERACDDLVLAAGILPLTYSQHLVDIASTYRSPEGITATAMTMAGKSQLADRVRCVLDDKRNRRSMTTSAAVIVVLLAVGITTTVATAGRVIERDAGGNLVRNLETSEGGSMTSEAKGKPVSQRVAQQEATTRVAELLQSDNDTLPAKTRELKPAKPEVSEPNEVLDQPGTYLAQAQVCSISIYVSKDGLLSYYVKGPAGTFYLAPTNSWSDNIPWIEPNIQRKRPRILSESIKQLAADKTWFACWDQSNRLWWYHEETGVLRMTVMGSILALERRDGLLRDDWESAPDAFLKRLPEMLRTVADDHSDKQDSDTVLTELNGTWQRFIPGERAVRENMQIEGNRETITRTWLDGTQRLLMVSRIERTVEGDVPIYNRTVLEFRQNGSTFDQIPEQQAFVYKLWEGLFYEIPGLLQGRKSIRKDTAVIPWHKAAG